MSLDILLYIACGFLLLPVLAVALAGSRQATPAIYGCALALSTAASALGIGGVGAEPAGINLPLALPWLGANFRLDSLAAFFVAVINLGGAGASLYALGYGRHERTAARVLPFFPAFLGGMNLVALADDAFTFLVAWEFMSLSSWALVVAHHRTAENVRAGFIYLVMASFGTACLLLAFGLLGGPNGDYGFAAMRNGNPAPGVEALVLGLVLAGAGSKAGLVPLHVWLPLAHPAAPSHVSALMSGVMTKVAVYAFLRFALDLLGPPEWWWAMPVLGIAGITTVMGVLHALMQHDLKRLLAYHTVENIGIIFIGIGLALAFQANGMNAAAALALSAALLHVLNHCLFKSLLFFGAGAVLTATGERDMERLGGLIHRMPRTAYAFLLGSAAISALPPLNGFVSEWLTFQAILLSPDLPQWGLRLLIPTVGALLALSAALAAACFVKAFGITFLGRARSDAAVRACETDQFSLAAMFCFAGLCVFLGVVPGIAIDWLAPVSAQLLGTQMPQQTANAWWTIVPIAEIRSSYNGFLVLLFIAAAAGLAVLVVHRFGSRAVRRSAPWDCGNPMPSPATQYTAESFAQPLRRVFGTVVFGARERVTMPPPGDLRPARFEVEMHDPSWDLIFAPLARGVWFTAGKLNALQFLTIRRYLTFVFLALVTLLLVLAIWR